MNELNQENYNQISNQITLKNESLKITPSGNKPSPTNEILYFSINQDSK